jgi:hypothetical protein
VCTAGSAGRQVLIAVAGVDPDQVDKFLAARAAAYENETPGTSRRRSQLPNVPLEAGSQFLSRSRSSVYAVDAEGVTAQGVKARLQAVVQLSGKRQGPYLILAWRDALAGPNVPRAIEGSN